MSGRDQESPTVVSLISKDILRRAFFIALILGSVLTLANQSGAIFGRDTVQVLPLVLVYLTPFVVITVSQVLGLRRATLDAQSGHAFAQDDAAFFLTVVSHGIPLRAFLVALVVGTANTSIVASNSLMASGSLSNLPTALIMQAFALPMMFGLVSQAVSYRRAVTSIGQRLQIAPQTLSISPPQAISLPQERHSSITTTTQSDITDIPFWRKSFNWIRAFEDTIDFDPTQASIDHLNHQVTDLKATVGNLESRLSTQEVRRP